MEIEAAVLTVQNVRFAVVMVQAHVVQYPQMGDAAIRQYRGRFPGMPIILMARNRIGKAVYYGREDIVRYLSNVRSETIPWQKFKVQRVA